MNELLQQVLAAHGGLEPWYRFNFVQATIITSGELFAMKDEPQDPIPRRMTVATKKEWASVTPFGSPGHKTDFTAGRIAIETLDGTVLNERLNPAGHAELGTVDAPWDALDRAYFSGYAVWTYLTTPFLLAMPRFSADEVDPWFEDGERWKRLRVQFPQEIESHSREQDFYFGPDYLLRRHDYRVEASGGFAAAQYVYEPRTVQGITLPIRRRAYMRDKENRAIREKLLVSIDMSEVAFL